MADITEQEYDKLEKFRNAIRDLELREEQRTDHFLIAWLRARDMNINKAHEMLKKSLEWRLQVDLYNILNWQPPKLFFTEYPFKITGMTEFGHPVFILPFGKWDVRKAVEAGKREEWLKYLDHLLATLHQHMIENSKKVGRPVTQFVVVLDFQGFSMRQVASLSNLNTIMEFVKRYENNYPEILNAAWVVNASRIFTIFFRFVKPLLSPRTLGKLCIHGTDKTEWSKALLNRIPSDQITVKYGGTQVSDINSSNNNLLSEAEFEYVVVEAGKRFNVDIHVHETESTLSWRFKTRDYDIGFCVLYNDENEVQSLGKLDSHLSEQIGSLCCEKSGKCKPCSVVYSLLKGYITSKFESIFVRL